MSSNRLCRFLLFYHNSLNQNFIIFRVFTFLLFACFLKQASCINVADVFNIQLKPTNWVAKRSVVNQQEHFCPSCGTCSYSINNKLRSKNTTNLHKILNCIEFNETQQFFESANRNPYLHRSYKCRCRYFRPNDNGHPILDGSGHGDEGYESALNSYDFDESYLNYMAEEEIKNVGANNENTVPTNECLVAYIGMAVKGHNLIYKQWINEENCFNLCLSTTKKNGYDFDCKSFEHWQSDCSSSSSAQQSSSTFVPRICTLMNENAAANDARHQAAFARNHRNHRHHNQNDPYLSPTAPTEISFLHNMPSVLPALPRSHRAVNKIEYCVLSNQSISTAGKDFTENNAVTYYEILCKRTLDKPKPLTTVVIKPTASKIQASSSKQTSSASKIKAGNFRLSTSPSIVQVTLSPQERPTLVISNSKSKSTRLTTTSVIYPTSAHHKSPKSSFTPAITSSMQLTPSNKCKFSPCLNDGECILVESERFTCACKDFFYGIYCESNAIKKVCHKTHMEIIIYQQFADQHQIEISDLYVNERRSPSMCKLKPINETHSRFWIPYEKCSTILINNTLEKIFTNKLYSASLNEKTGESTSNILSQFECRFDRISSKATTITAAAKSSFTIEDSNELNRPNNDKISKSTVPCIIDLLNLKIRLFHDVNYYNEIKTGKLELIKLTRSSHVSYNKPIYVQFSVFHSEKLNEFYELQDKLKYFHLTIERCWLTETQNEDSKNLQTLIKNGCPKERTNFDKFPIKSSIRFSFFTAKLFRIRKLTQFYLHCFPEICTDAPKNSEHYTSFYSQFKSCHNISNACHKETRNVYQSNEYGLDTPDDLKDEHENQEDDSEYSSLPPRLAKRVPSAFTHQNHEHLSKKITLFNENSYYKSPITNQCNNKYSLGPIHFSDSVTGQNAYKTNVIGSSSESKHQSKLIINKVNAIMFTFFLVYIYVII